MVIESLEKLLATSDECIHTVTVIREMPEGLDGKQVMRHLQTTIGGECASVALKFPNAIELTLTARGGRRQVLSAANTLLSEGISAAQAEVWVRLRFGRTSHCKG